MRLALSIILLALTSTMRWFSRHDDWSDAASLPASLTESLPYLLGCAFWLSLAWVLSQILGSAIRLRARRRGTEDLLPRLLIDLGTLVIFFLALLAIVSEVFGRSLTGLLATSGAMAAVIGFALQRMISDILAGIALNIGRSGLKLGDWVQVPGEPVGRVAMIGWHTTQLVTIEGKSVIVPNGMMASGIIVNFSAPERRFRVSQNLTLSYSLPPQRAMAVLQSAMVATPGVLSVPTPQVLINDCSSNGVEYALAFWVPDYPESQPISRDVLANAITFLDQIGWAPAIPHQEVAILQKSTAGLTQTLDIAAILRRVPLFEPFQDQAFALLEKGATLHEMPVGTAAAREGDPGDSLFVIVSGLLDVQKRGPQGSVTVARLKPGGVFGEMSLLTGAPRSATVAAVTPVLLIEIGKQHLQTIFDWHPEVLEELTRIQAERLASNQASLMLTIVEQEEIAKIGLKEFLRAKISSFFAVSPPARPARMA